jgi:hypothetical protein
MGKDRIGTVVAILTVLVLALGLWGYHSLPDLFKDLSSPKSLPFEITITPSYFSEGFYTYNDKFPISITINEKVGRNITYLELTKENFRVSRKDTGLNKPVSRQILWDYNSGSKDILLFGNENPSFAGSYFGSFPLKATGNILSCENCFIGTQYPYIFTLTIHYKEDGEEIKQETITKEIPLK